jgi:hypothetical protein
LPAGLELHFTALNSPEGPLQIQAGDKSSQPMKKKSVYFILAIAAGAYTHAAVLNPANGHLYDIVPGAKSWSDANAEAIAMGGYLATITSAEENDFIAATFPSAVELGFWLGGFQPGGPEPDGGWEWVTGEPFHYTNWAGGEPNDAGGEDRLHFDTFGTGGGTWNDLSDGVFPENVDGFVIEFDDGVHTPDGGATLGLLGIGLAGFTFAARGASNSHFDLAATRRRGAGACLADCGGGMKGKFTHSSRL